MMRAHPPAEHAASRGLTRGQHTLWAAQQAYPDKPLYNQAFLFEIDGRIEPGRFTQAFNKLVDSCGVMRTVIEVDDGVPRQRVLADAGIELQHIDLSAEPNPPDAAHQWAQSRCGTMFQIDRGLLDSALIRLGTDSYAWYLNQHHVVCDAWSISLLFEQMSAWYAALARDSESKVEPLPVYSDYLDYEAQTEHTPEQAQHWDRYRDPSAAAPALYGESIELSSTRNHRLTLPLSGELMDRLKQQAMSAGVRGLTLDQGLFRLMSTALFACLYRVTDEDRLVIAAPAHSRVSAAYKRTPGLFTEVFPLGIRIEPGETFQTLFDKVRDESDAFLRAATPGGSDPALNRGVAAVMNYIRGGFGSFDSLPTRTTWLHAGHVEPQHPLRVHIHVFDKTGRLTVLMDCHDALLGAGIPRDLPGHLLRTLEAMLSGWDHPIDSFSILSSEEHDAILRLGAANASTPQPPQTVLEGFDRVVESSPDSPAIHDGPTTWSYRELSERAWGIASQVRPGEAVGLCMRRSAELIVGILGVLRGGGTFVPLDPDWPAARIEAVLGDAGCTAIMDDDDRMLGLRRIGLERDTDPSINPVTIAGDSLAYMLFTSGSTGRPKGVMIEHRALAHYIDWASHAYDRGRRLSFPLFTSPTFDLTMTSIFVPLVSGGSIVVYPEADSDADLAVHRVFEEDRVDVVKLTPSHLALITELDLARSRVGQLIVGGEQLTTALARKTHDCFGGAVEIHNEYGPTEATVGCIVQRYDPSEHTGAAVPIGRPIDRMRGYVVGPGGLPQPVGVSGELVLAGAGLALGYAADDAQTRAAFVPGHHVNAKRLYRTGDRARVRPDGVFEYLGRTDDQVKVRGARIELGEVEAALSAYPGVRQAAAALRSRRSFEQTPEQRCTRCGLDSDYPGVVFDAAGVCNHCIEFERYSTRANLYFKSMPELEKLFADQRSSPPPTYDCLALFSGGKDSAYMLCRLADMGLRVLAFTLDNGYISEQAKANIRRVVDTLGVDHTFAQTEAMNEIFVDSLLRHANVCHGCFKAIYTLAIQTALDRDIPMIVTGLSRGQFFETRLTPEVFTQITVSAERIDADVLEARKAYHRVDDAVHQRLDVSMFEDDAVFERVRFVDFYRYCDVELDELFAYLDRRVPWVRPSDTGRSSNCLINDVGIYVHRRLRGFHNYALPYSWDVRMGHKTRDAAVEELDDEIDPAGVQRILEEIGYPGDVAGLSGAPALIGYYAADAQIPAAELRAHLRKHLPDAAIPSQFMRVDEIPLSRNGKADRDALPEPEAISDRAAVDSDYQAPTTPGEQALAGIWADVFGMDRIGRHDDFFELGGDSLMAIQIVARARRAGLVFTLAQLFEQPTVAGLAALAGTRAVGSERVTGAVPLLPAQAWLLDEQAHPEHFNQSIIADLPPGTDPAELARALNLVLKHHDAFAQRFLRIPEGWETRIEEQAPAIACPAFTVSEGHSAESMLDELAGPFDLDRAPLIRCACLLGGAYPRLIAVAHHLVIDAVSWQVLLDDLSDVLQQIKRGMQITLPVATTSPGVWARSLTQSANEIKAAQIEYWRTALGDFPDAPEPIADAGRVSDEASVRVSLAQSRTQALLDGAPRWRLGVDEVLVASLALALAEADGRSRVNLVLEGHGRESSDPQIDATRSIGWFTSMFPVCLDLATREPGIALMHQVRDQLRHAVKRGAGFGVLRYLHPDPQVRDALIQPLHQRVLFNYLGRTSESRPDANAVAQAGPIRLDRAPACSRAAGLDIHAYVSDGALQMVWAYHQGRRACSDVQALAEYCLAYADSLIASLESEGSARGGASKGLAGLSETEMSKLAALLGDQEGS